MIFVASNLLKDITLNQGDAALQDLAPGVTLGYFAVVCDGHELQMLDNSKAKAVRALMKTRNYYQKHGVIPVAVFWTHNKYMLSTLTNLGYLCICANGKDLDAETRAMYAKVAEITDAEQYAFKITYWLRMPDTDLDEPIESPTRELIDKLAKDGSVVIELDACSITIPEVLQQLKDPASLIRQADQTSPSQPADEFKYIDFQTQEQVHPIDKTMPLVVPEGVLDIHEKLQPKVVGIGN